MKSTENIVFLGMMGSGKSTMGSLISSKLKLNFIDTDQLIESKLGESISNIFKNKGEKFFREIEEKITLETLKKKNIVIALGGGTFLNNKIRKEVLSSHVSIWLKWDIETLLKRIQKSSKRPVAFNSSRDELVDLIKKRSNIYSKALYTIDCNNLKKSEVVNKIIDIYESKKINY
tara:strand:- start:1768 stop:2292 length:525 start_codon:yes stop_codon:yes gene_type:complete